MKNTQQKITVYCVVLYYSTFQHNYNVKQRYFRTEEQAIACQESNDHIKTEMYPKEFADYEEALNFFMNA